ELDKVDMPMGIPIGAETPEEIALSILARMIAVKNSLSISG
ncbi:MAG TPA: XdhC family protein, partial [Bacteroidia bacterium]|nr:XdhC family protein [Bacteroidia bacterium]